MSTDHVRERESALTDRASVRLSATLLLVGQLLYILVTQLHAGGQANDHRAIFGTYAASEAWKPVHVGQFVAMVVLVAGLLVLSSPRDVAGGGPAWAARLGSALAVVSLALYAVLQAVDGVANQEVDRAWVGAQGPDESARFAAAEAIRWLEWGVRSYHDYALGLALILLAVVVLRTAGVPATVAHLMALTGVVYLAQGWVVGAEGFSGTHTVLILAAWVLGLTWMVWLLVAAGRSRSRGRPAPGPAR